MLRLVIFLLLIAPPVAGGPWMRAPGHGFVSISTEVPLSPDATRWTYNAAYAEYGLTPRLAIGLDMGMNLDDSGKALVFLRTPLLQDRLSWPLAVELGAGAHFRQGLAEPVLRPGLSLGRSLDTGWGPVWAVADLSATYRGEQGDVLPKLDLVLGLDRTARSSFVLRLTTEKWPGQDVVFTAEPSIVHSFHERARLQVGLALRSDGLPPALKLGIWTDLRPRGPVN